MYSPYDPFVRHILADRMTNDTFQKFQDMAQNSGICPVHHADRLISPDRLTARTTVRDGSDYDYFYRFLLGTFQYFTTN